MKLDLKGNTSQEGTPTPTSPIPVSVVSGDNSINTYGKNLLDINASSFSTQTLNGVTITNNGDGSIKLNGTVTGNAFSLKTSSNTPSRINTGTKYYLKVNTLSGTVEDAFSTIVYGNYNGGANTALINVYNAEEGSFTAASDYDKVWVYIYAAVGKKFNNLVIKPILSTLQNTSYEPYQSQTHSIYLGVENILPSELTIINAYLNNGGTTTPANDWKCIETYVEVQPSQTYKASCSNMGARFIYCEYNSSKQVIGTRTENTTGIMATSSTTKYVRFCTNNSTATDFQLELGNKQNHISTTPIELCKIGDYQDYFTKNSGKNLIEPKMASTTQNGITCTNNGDGTFTIDGTASANTTFRLNQSTYNGSDNLQTYNGTYTLSCNQIENNMELNIMQNGTWTSPMGIKNNNTPVSATIDNVDNCFIYLLVRSGKSVNNLVVRPMLEKSSTASIFEPYGTGQWCKYNAIGKIVLDGSEKGGSLVDSNQRIAFTSSSNPKFANVLINTTDSVANNSPSFATHFTLKSQSEITPTNNSFAFSQWGSTKYIYFSAIENTAEAFKNWLSSNNVKIYYPLATPYLSLIEDNNLIEQLDNLENAMSYEGQTNISQVNNDKAFIISAKALEDGTNEVVVNNIGNVYSKPLLALEGNGNVDIYLDNTQILRANLEDKMNIDIAQLEAYNPDTMTLLNRQVIGNYNSMTLQPGNNTIRIDGSLDKATITNYTRYL